MMDDKQRSNWLEKVTNPSQVGGIETSVLDNGLGAGTRIAWINTGAGLRFKVVIDRAMDIADAFFNQHSLSWLSRLGAMKAQPFADRGTDWLRTFGGGLLVTCGLTHTGGPEQDDFGARGLHDQISNSPAEIIAIIQPDLRDAEPTMSMTGIIRQGHPLGPNLELKRTIQAVLGKPTIYIDDRITNYGNTAVPHMLLYHFNFGWPLVDEGSRLLWHGSWEARETGAKNKLFKEGQAFKKCSAPLSIHNGQGEEAAFIDVKSDPNGKCQCGVYNEHLGLAVSLSFQKSQLPWLTNWQHWGRGEYVTGLEPGTHPPIGQHKARAQQQLILLKPGESRGYTLTLDVISQQAAIEKLLSTYTDEL